MPPKKKWKLLKIVAKPPRLPACLARLRRARQKIRSSYIQNIPPSLAEAASYGGCSPQVDRREGEKIMCIVYILKCSDEKLYIGCTEDLDERLARHNNGYVPATENRRPVKLITHIVFNDKYKAFEFEKYLNQLGIKLKHGGKRKN